MPRMPDAGLPRYAFERLRGIVRPRVRIGGPPAGVAVDWDVPVPVRDGTVLRVNVFRPANGSRCPVFMSAHPYGKDRLPANGRASAQYRMLRQPVPVAFSAWTGWEAPDPALWVPRGYAVVNCDLRGCGTSAGVGSILSDQEAEDYFDLIEWASAQPWSTGKVGLNGVSYLAISQYKTAALHPPALAAICPWEGFTDAYRDLLLPGGIREDGFVRIWTRGLRGQRLEGDIRRTQFARPLRDEWWRALVPDLARIDVPMLVCGSFSDHCLHSSGSFRAFEQASSPQRWLYTHRGGKWATYYSTDALAAQQRFFDHFLKGADNGQAEQPPVRLAVHDVRDAPAEVRAEQEWPLARADWRELHLLPDGRLAAEPGSAAGEVPFDLRTGAAVFRWAVPEAIELSGPMAAHLRLELRGIGDATCSPAWRSGGTGAASRSRAPTATGSTASRRAGSRRRTACSTPSARGRGRRSTRTSIRVRWRPARSSPWTSVCVRRRPGSARATSCGSSSAAAGSPRATPSSASCRRRTSAAARARPCCIAEGPRARTCSCPRSRELRASRRPPVQR
jgi:predicted acyl esterase